MKSPRSLEFTERMAGHYSLRNLTLNSEAPLPRQDFKSAEADVSRKPFEFTLTISIKDLDQFLGDPQLNASAFGTITHPLGKGSLTVEKGSFNLFKRPQASPDLNAAKEMQYLLFLRDDAGEVWTFFGFKEVLKEDGFAAWEQTTTLYFYLWKGHSTFSEASPKQIIGLGVLYISVSDFIKQLGTFKTNADDLFEEKKTVTQFLSVFASHLWEAYAPFVFTTTASRWNEHHFPVNTTQGVALGEKTLHPFDTDDGLTLSLQRFKVADSKKIVLLLHGLTTSTDMYIMPEQNNLVNYLHANGFTDVWSLDWRGSGRFTYNLSPHRYTIDDVAKYDIPKALEFIREVCGEDVKINIIAHCVGSLSLMCSIAAGYAKDIQCVVSNSVSLTPMVHWQGLIKIFFGPELLEYVFRYAYISPKLPYLPGLGFGKWLYWMERLIRRECTEPACHLVSFMWGWGFPAAYKHRNLHPITHRRLVDLFGGTSFHYHRHIRKMLFKKAAVSYDSKKPLNYLEEIRNRETLPPILLMSGGENNIFPGSNKRTYELMQATPHAKKFNYVEFPEYGHQDVLMGQYCHIEVFPKILSFLQEHGG